VKVIVTRGGSKKSRIVMAVAGEKRRDWDPEKKSSVESGISKVISKNGKLIKRGSAIGLIRERRGRRKN